MTSGSGQGIILIFFRTRDSSRTFPKPVEQWLQQEYVPALSASAGIKAAWQYTAADAAYDKQKLVVCRVSDLVPVQVEILSCLARSGKVSLPVGLTDGSIGYELRSYSFVQLYETAEKDQGKLHGIAYVMDK
jgi:hypothetical protein